MIQSYINTVTPLTSNSASVAFQTDCIRTNSSCGCNGWLCHSEGSPTYTITSGGYYDISFHGSISSAAGGVVAFALFNNGEMIPGTLMAETLAAANDYADIGIDKTIKVCCKANANISVRAIPAVPTPTAPATLVDTQTPIIVNANLVIDRRS